MFGFELGVGPSTIEGVNKGGYINASDYSASEEAAILSLAEKFAALADSETKADSAKQK